MIITTIMQKRDRHRRVVVPNLRPPLPFFGIAGEDRQHAVDAGIDARRVIALLELRRDGGGDDDPRQGVGQRALESIADFDADLALLGATSSNAPLLVFACPSFHCRNSRFA